MRSLCAVTVALLLLLTGCGLGGDDSEKSTPQAPASSTPADSPPTEEPVQQDPDLAPDRTTVELVDGQTQTTLQFNEIECDRGGEQLRFLLAKADSGRILLKVEGQRFVLVKQGRGEPKRAENPQGVELGADSVTFRDVRLSGGATLNGKLVCPDPGN